MTAVFQVTAYGNILKHQSGICGLTENGFASFQKRRKKFFQKIFQLKNIYYKQAECVQSKAYVLNLLSTKT